jgi:prepilin peptidase CpaA
MDALAQRALFTGGALGIAGIASVHDVRSRRIPNFVTAPALLAGLMFHFSAGGWAECSTAALAGLIAGGLFFLLHCAGGMGGGDVKLMAAVCAIAGLPQLQLMLVATVTAGGVAALAVAMYNGRLRETGLNVAALVAHHSRAGIAPHPELNLGNQRTLRLPYALPIAAGCLAAFCVALTEVRP